MSDPIRRDPPYVFCVRFLFQALIICIDLPLSSLLRWSTRHILTPPPTFSTDSSSLAGCQVRYSLNSCCCLLFSWFQSMDFVLNFVANKRLGPLDSRVSFLFLLLLAILLYVSLFMSLVAAVFLIRWGAAEAEGGQGEDTLQRGWWAGLQHGLGPSFMKWYQVS